MTRMAYLLHGLLPDVRRIAASDNLGEAVMGIFRLARELVVV